MPYIEGSRRAALKSIADAHGVRPQTPGELAYVLADAIDEYLLEKSPNGEYSYADRNEVMGVLASLQHEFYERGLRKYEKRKRRENGEVFYSLNTDGESS